MRLLLDTQVMLWWLLDAPRLKADTRQLIRGHSCLVSVASIWEVAIKHRLGKLPVAPESFGITACRAEQRSYPCSTATPSKRAPYPASTTTRSIAC